MSALYVLKHKNDRSTMQISDDDEPSDIELQHNWGPYLAPNPFKSRFRFFKYNKNQRWLY